MIPEILQTLVKVYKKNKYSRSTSTLVPGTIYLYSENNIVIDINIKSELSFYRIKDKGGHIIWLPRKPHRTAYSVNTIYVYI